MSVYTVLYNDNFKKLLAKIKRILNKCDKAGVPYVFTCGDSYYRTITTPGGTPFQISVVDVEIECKLKHNGWTVLGSVVRKEGITQCYFRNNEELWKEYNDIEFRCDHCHKNVQRNSVVILENEQGERKIVGTNCVKEFTKGLDGELICALDELRLLLLEEELETGSFTDKDASETEENTAGVQPVIQFNVKYFLATAFKAIRLYGFTQSRYEDSTRYICCQNYRLDWYDACDVDNAELAIKWILSLPDDSLNNYLYNLKQIVSSEWCLVTHTAILASMPIAYFKSLKSKDSNEDTKEKLVSHYVGTVGDKLNLEVTLLKTISYRSMYGTGYFHIFTDSKGNVYKWSTNKWLVIADGTPLSLTGTVKAHEEYRGVEQTVLTRCKVTKIEK